MLNTFRTKIKFWSHIALWPVIIAFIAFYGWSFVGTKKTNPNLAATVGPIQIGKDAVLAAQQRIMDYYKNIYKDNFSQFAKNMNFQQMALDQVVDDAVLLLAADEMGVTVSDDEIKKTIMTTPYFQKNGQFSPNLYHLLLRNAHMSPKQYEESVRKDLRLRKVRALIGTLVPVTDDEIREDYISKNVKINCDLYKFSYRDHLDKVKVTDEEIQKYYDENGESFRVGDQIKVAYIKLDPKQFEKDVEIEPEDIDDYYDEHFDQYTVPEQVRASHILVKVDRNAKPEDWEKARQKAESIRKRIDNGEDFATLAKTLSEDETTAERGGDLGFFQRGRMVKPFDDAVWSMDVGDVSDPVKTVYGYHIIKKTDYKKKSYKSQEEVEKSIRKALLIEGSKKLAMEKMRALFDEAEEDTKIEEIAKKAGLTVETSEFFEPDKPPMKTFGFARNLKEIFKNLEPGILSIPVETNQGIFMFQIKKQRKSHIPPLDEIRDKVESEAKKMKAKALAETEARDVLNELRSGKSWEDVGAERKLTSLQTGEFAKGSYVPKVGVDEKLVAELFSMNIGDISDVKEVRDNYFIFRISDKKPFDEKAFQKELPALKKKMIASRQYQAVSTWVAQRREQLQHEGKLVLYMTPEENES